MFFSSRYITYLVFSCLHFRPGPNRILSFFCSWPSAKRYIWICMPFETIFNKTWPIIFSKDAFPVVENIKHDARVNQSFLTTVRLLSLSAQAGL